MGNKVDCFKIVLNKYSFYTIIMYFKRCGTSHTIWLSKQKSRKAEKQKSASPDITSGEALFLVKTAG